MERPRICKLREVLEAEVGRDGRSLLPGEVRKRPCEEATTGGSSCYPALRQSCLRHRDPNPQEPTSSPITIPEGILGEADGFTENVFNGLTLLSRKELSGPPVESVPRPSMHLPLSVCICFFVLHLSLVIQPLSLSSPSLSLSLFVALIFQRDSVLLVLVGPLPNGRHGSSPTWGLQFQDVLYGPIQR